jgi:arsenite/tail-anchored protein-transporting ATPase
VTTRVLLLTGKGGVGKTTSAAATACLAARRHARVLVMSTDGAHSLGDALGVDVGASPTRVTDQLWAQHVDAQRHFEQSWQTVQQYLTSVLDAAGVDHITAQELTVLPGAEEVLALLELRQQVRSGDWDVVVVDCAPTAETLRLLALPEALAWYMDRVFPRNRRVVRALRPVLNLTAGVPMPQDTVFDAVQRLHDDLADLREILAGKGSSVRLVLTPERVVLAESRRTWTTLSLLGYAVDGVVVNRIFPEDAADGWGRGWVASQRRMLAEVRASFHGLPLWAAPYQAAEPVGREALDALAEQIYGETDALALGDEEGPLRLHRAGDEVILSLSLPFATRDDVDLARHGDDLIITVGSHRRVMALPTAVRHLAIAGAGLHDGALRVRFEPEGQS